jgi:glycosyltransferase involved in cell wall biosynthesis
LNIVFIHPRFPGPFGLLAQVPGKNRNNKTFFITSAAFKDAGNIPGVTKLVFPQTPPAQHHTDIPKAEIQPGLAVAHILAGLKRQQIVPDLIIGHSGSGTAFYVKDVFPHTPFLCFFEWYHTPDTVQDISTPVTGSDLKRRMDLRNRNLAILSDLCACDHGICPTAWQKDQFPEPFHKKLSVVHPGIDTHVFHPRKDQRFKTDFLDLSEAKHLITYTTNTLAPYMGFWQFMAALPDVLKLKPGTHIVIAGADRIVLETSSGGKKSYKSMICEKMDLNSKQVHFLENLSHDHYVTLLQASSVHVCIDSPLRVSPSLLQAMSCECLVMAPDISPVKEIITDGTNGIIVDFSTPVTISKKILACLNYPSFMKPLKQKARQTVIENHALEKTLPLHLEIMHTLVNPKKRDQFG